MPLPVQFTANYSGLLADEAVLVDAAVQLAVLVDAAVVVAVPVAALPRLTNS